MSKALDYLIREGIDCIKIAGPRKGDFKTVFYPINIHESKNFVHELNNDYEGNVLTDDFMLIESDFMQGYEIKELNSKLKVENKKLYDVIKITYY